VTYSIKCSSLLAIGEKGVKPIKCISINTTSVCIDNGWTRLTFYSIILSRESRKEGLSLNVIIEVLYCGLLEAKEWTVNVIRCSSWRLARRASWKVSAL
jgi:hypothetical protein